MGIGTKTKKFLNDVFNYEPSFRKGQLGAEGDIQLGTLLGNGRLAGYKRLTTVGGAASEAVAVTGAKVGDGVVVFLNVAGAVPRTIVSASVTAADVVTVVFSGDPSNDHQITILVVRDNSDVA